MPRLAADRPAPGFGMGRNGSAAARLGDAVFGTDIGRYGRGAGSVLNPFKADVNPL